MTPQEAFKLAQPGFRAYSEDRLDDAEAVADTILRASPRDVNGLYLKGIARRARSDAEGALKYLLPADEMAPGQVNIGTAIGLALQDLRRYDEARARFEAVAMQVPNAPEPHRYLGTLKSSLRDRVGAIASWRRAMALGLRDKQLLTALAHALEQAGEREEAGALIDEALALEPHDPAAIAVRAMIDFEAKNYDAVIDRVENDIRLDVGDSTDIAQAIGILGDALERKGDFRDAFDAYLRSNEVARKAAAEEFESFDGLYSLEGARRVRRIVERAPPQERPSQSDPTRVAFLVGFPRSGTTLLEQVLSTHSLVVSSDERPTLHAVVRRVWDERGGLEAALSRKSEDFEDLRRAYWNAAAPQGLPSSRHIFLDKLPLSIVWLGLIAKLFPDAPILLALRDPRDAVLSAFKRRFAMNTAMFYMLRLTDAAAYYDAALGAGEAARRAFPWLDVHEVRYEELVTELENVARSAVAALRLEWEPDVLRYRDFIRSRTISTPSARQVVKPLNTSAIGVWRNYREPLGTTRPTLEPWVRHWRYAPWEEAEDG